MKPIVRLAVFSCFLFLCALSVQADLTEDVRALLRNKIFAKAEVGVEIVDLSQSEQPKIVFRHNSDIPLIPASNLKLVTTAAALEKLGPDYAFKTLLIKRGDDLVIVGDGDPTFGDVEMLRKVGWDVDTIFKSWAENLKKLGITSVNNVLVDDSIFDQQFVHPSWPADQLHKRYVAQVAGLNLNANCIDFYLKVNGSGSKVSYGTVPATSYVQVDNECVGGNQNAVWLSRVLGSNTVVLKGEVPRSNIEPISVTIEDPSLFAATVLAETLKSNGIEVRGKVDRDRTIREKVGRQAWSEDFKLIGMHSTRVYDVVSRANKDSMNLYAEALCKRVGAEASGKPGSWENGTAAVKDFLTTTVGIPADEISLDDGCGLSRKNTISANAIAQLLVYENRKSSANSFLQTLAVGGEDGTLDKRFRDDLKGRVFAKSGYVNGVSCLSGYVKTKSGKDFAFSILMNGVTSGSAKTVQEKIVKAIDQND